MGIGRMYGDANYDPFIALMTIKFGTCRSRCCSPSSALPSGVSDGSITHSTPEAARDVIIDLVMKRIAVARNEA
jgi:hypothetical protein